MRKPPGNKFTGLIVNQVEPPRRGPGRPSKAAERKLEILFATANVAARDGLAGITMDKVAEEAGLQRTLVLHYFGNRQALVDSFVDQVVSLYGEVQILKDSSDSVADKLNQLFDEGFWVRREDLSIWLDLVAISARDVAIRQELSRLWRERWLPRIEQELRSGFPSTSAERIKRVAYGLACLVEGYWSIHAQGVDDPERSRQAKGSALALLEQLGAQASGKKRRSRK